MKKLLLVALIAAGSLAMGNQAKAQVSIHINIGSQPAWGPTGYDNVQYYYLPDINAYYDVATAQYIYLSGKRWVFAKQLPHKYANYDIYHSYKVVVNRVNPYRNNAADIRAYSKYKGVHNQPMIRDSRDRKYYVNSGNRYHNQWNKQQNGNKNSRSRGHDNNNHRRRG